MKLSLVALILLSSACQDFNSNTYDRDKYGVIELTGSAAFKKSYPILQNRCMNCHTHSQWSAYMDEQDWGNENLVVFGDAAASKLIFRIKNYGAANSDMPLGGSNLPQAEYETLLKWVQP